MGIVFISRWTCIRLPIWGAIGYSLIRGAFKKHVVTFQKVEGPINIVKSVREWPHNELATLLRRG